MSAMRYVKKTSAVEAIQLDCSITITHMRACAEDDTVYEIGEPGDYLVKENGQCRIMKRGTFEREYRVEAEHPWVFPPTPPPSPPITPWVQLPQITNPQPKPQWERYGHQGPMCQQADYSLPGDKFMDMP